jgi:uncharacterized alkaline shock family protein YloU
MDDNRFGKTTIAQDVLISIARLTTINVQGVKSTSPFVNSYDRIVTKPDNEGVKVAIKDNLVFVEIYVILESDVNVRVVSKNIQLNVSRAISDMVGMEVGSINIHICDIAYNT